MARQVTLFFLLLCVLASALGVVYAKHQSRKLFVQLQVLNDERDRLNIQWGRLQLEQSTLAAPVRVEHAARDRLGMKVPAAASIRMVSP